MKRKFILYHGKIYSVEKDGELIKGTALAVEDGKIVKIGTDEELLDWADARTEKIDCQGNTILPGLCDSHCHPGIAAGLYAGCDLYGVYIQKGQTPDDIVDIYLNKLKQFIDANPDNTVYRGSGWVINNFPEDRMPTRHDLDKICSNKPIILESFCIHYAWVNTKALELAGLDAETPDVYAGKIYREADGYPSGLLSQPEAMDLVKLKVEGYDYSVAQYKEAFLKYQQEYANNYGVTLIQGCMHTDNAREAYIELAREGKLTTRVRGVYVLEPGRFKEQLPAFIARKGQDNVGDDFRIDTIKIFTEGEFVYSQPYETSYLKENGLPSDHNGILYWSDEDLTECIETAMKNGFNVHLHAMGDMSVNQSVACIAKAQKNTNLYPRNIVAHLMLVDDETAKIMGKEKIICNCMPRWMVYDSDIAGMVPMIGSERAERCYPYRVLQKNGAMVTFGTDFPVTPPPNPFHGIQCAMTRKVFPNAPDYKQFKGKVLGTEEPASLKEAVQCNTINGAVQLFAEEYTGSISVGKSADFVLLNVDLECISPEEIYNIQIEKTVFKGAFVYEKREVNHGNNSSK